MKNYKQYLIMIGKVILYLGIFVVNMNLMNFIVKLLKKTALNNIINYLLGEWRLWVILYFVIPVIIYFLIFTIRKENFFNACRFKKMPLMDLLLVSIISVAGISFTLHFINTTFALKYLPEFDEYITNVTKGNWFTIFVMSGIIIPTCEEVLFRGLIFNEMRKYMPVLAVVLTHHLIYMFFQPNIQVAVYAYFNFIIYALVFVLTDSLWGPVLFEIIGAVGLYATKLAGLDIMLRGFGDLYLFIAAIISLIILLILIFNLKKNSLKNIFFNKNYSNTSTAKLIKEE